MPGYPTGTDLLVLHALRCIGFAALARVADAAGVAEADAESELIDLAVAGLVTRVPGEFGGWARLLTASAAAHVHRLLAWADEVTGAGAAVYGETERLNAAHALLRTRPA